MEALVLCYRGEPLREFPLEGGSVEVGRAPYCDIVVHDPGVADRELLLRRSGGTVVAYDLRRRGGRAKPRPVPPGKPLPLGRHHSLVRLPEAASVNAAPAEGRTEELVCADASPVSLVVVVGWGAEARRVPLRDRPIMVGADAGNDMVLSDRAVSGQHCRLERDGAEVVVRDLGSRNGTWVEGVRVGTARVGAGTRLRVGRTDLMIVPRGRPVGARDAGLVAQSAAMLGVLGEVERLARLSWPVLVEGESGSGKEGVARALHDRSPRAARPFVALNAGGLPRELIESELFGHERGAFTGAVGTHRGVFEQADGGTLFLDEVGELPLAMQARLLRVLETWDVRRVGGESAVRVDVRLVCATHRDLRAMVGDGSFRRDLYYRVARLVVQVPPLRERPEDVRALADHFLRTMEAEVGRRTLEEPAVERLLAHRWPGNARELRNVLSAAAAATPSQVIRAEDVARAIERMGNAVELPAESAEGLRALLQRHRGNVAAAARSLGVPRSTLRDRIRRVTEEDQRMTKPA
ncbi:MAG: sigma 54-interacting transcriptional regulator [Myxococcota bacterium]